MAKEKLAKIKSEKEMLKRENAELKKKNTELFYRLSKKEQFIENNGVLFKKKADGNFEPCAFYPTYKMALVEFPPRSDENHVCSKCNYIASFRPRQLNNICANTVREYF